jgi:hypothetical protein
MGSLYLIVKYYTTPSEAHSARSERRWDTLREVDALGLLAESALASDLDRGTAGDRYQVVLHVDEVTLNADTGAADGEAVAPDAGQAVVEDVDGARVSGETSRRIACDASTVVMRHTPDGSLLDVGRKRRTIPPAIRQALAARDRHCQFPGCIARHCDAHHLQHWSNGGATDQSCFAVQTASSSPPRRRLHAHARSGWHGPRVSTRWSAAAGRTAPAEMGHPERRCGGPARAQHRAVDGRGHPHWPTHGHPRLVRRTVRPALRARRAPRSPQWPSHGRFRGRGGRDVARGRRRSHGDHTSGALVSRMN